MNMTKTGKPARAVNDKAILRTTRKDFDIFCKQTAGFVKPFLDWKEKKAKANPKAQYVIDSVKAGVNYNPLTDQPTPKGYKKPEIARPFWGFYIERKDRMGHYRFFCPLLLTSNPVFAPAPAMFPIGALLAFWDGLPKKSGGRVEIGEYIFEIEGEQ